MSEATRSGTLRTTLTASGALTTAMLPTFLLGALSDQVRRDLGIDETAIGAAVTVLFVSVGLAAAPASRITERLGSALALRTGVVISGLATAAIGAFASAWWQLALPLAAVGIAVGLIDTGAARAFADGVASDRQGSAFGLKEASVPGASLLAGIALPTVGVMLGWRATFVAALAVAALVLVLLPRGGPAAAPPDRTTATGPPPPPTRIRRFAVGVGLGAGSVTAAATFLAPAITDRGLSTTAAGATLAVASLASIAARIAVGRWADRDDAPTVRAVTAMLLCGAAGAGILATAAPAPVAVLAAVALLGGGWGWTGLAFLSVVRSHPGAPAVAAGIVLTGLGIGGALGPPAFGALASRLSYPAAWSATALALLAASAVTASARPRTSPAPTAR
ncbi:MAG: MFS transporter [Nitriliruptor sp.]